MTGGALGDLLPLAIGIAISPIPIIACILLLFSPRARANGLAFLLGWVVGITAVTILVRLLADTSGATDDRSGGGASLGDWIVLLLGLGAIVLGVRQWRSRPAPGTAPTMPAWMDAIDGFTPVKAMGFGLALSALNPKNLGLAVAAGVAIEAAVAAGGDALVLEIVFVVLASLSIVVPVIYVLIGGDGARSNLEGWRTWLTANNAAVMAVLFLVIGAKLVGAGLDAVLG
jgi:hypothetical protein